MKLTFIHVIDQIQHEPGTAQLAALARGRGIVCESLAVDYGTDAADFLAGLVADPPAAAVIRVTMATREVLTYLAGVLAEKVPGLPVILHGPLVAVDANEVAGMADPAAVLTGDGDAAFLSLLDAWHGGPLPEAAPAGCRLLRDGAVVAGDVLEPADAEALPLPDRDLFGGDEMLRRATAASFFGEIGVATLETAIGTPSGLPPNAALQAFNHPSCTAPRLRYAPEIHRQLCELAPRVRHFEIHDREFGFVPSFADAVLEAIYRDLPQRTLSLRVLAATADAAWIDALDPDRVRRVVFEYDAPSERLAERVPGLQPPGAVAALAERLRRRGIEPSLLVSVGLPFETREDIEGKLELIRGSGATRARFLPFEPCFGHPVYDLCRRERMLPEGEAAWNREVYTPLRQPSLPEEDWYEVWQQCLDVQAELQLSHAAEFDVRTSGSRS